MQKSESYRPIEGDVKIIGLKKYAHGFTGCIETPHHYEFFHLARGRYKALQKYMKADFSDRDHFFDFMRKFVHTGFFTDPPIAAGRITLEALEQILQK